MTPALSFKRHDGDSAATLGDELADIYTESWAHQRNNPFRSRAAFLDRHESYRRAPGFTLVTAEDDGGLVGFIFGYPLPPGSRWWEGLTPAPPEDFERETGDRTFALNEMHVRPAHRRQGIAHALNAELPHGRVEQRVTLCVDPANQPAWTAYRAWGYTVVGQLKPFPDSPTFDVLVLDLSA